MKETRPDELFEAWLALPEEQRHGMDAQFREIFDMSCEKGFRAILDEARWQMQAEQPEALTEFVEILSALPNHKAQGTGRAAALVDAGGCRPVDPSGRIRAQSAPSGGFDPPGAEHRYAPRGNAGARMAEGRHQGGAHPP